MTTETKPGYLTTEFWVTLAVVLTACAYVIIRTVRGDLDVGDLGALLLAGANAGLYSSHRAKQKTTPEPEGDGVDPPPTSPPAP